MIYDIIIIGAGAAGLFCSSTMSRKTKGLILEKTARPGTKLLMSGSGQCNITHAGSIKEFVSCYGKNGSKIRTCLYKYSNTSLVDFLRENGIATFTRKDGKIFPTSMDSREVLNMLLRKTEDNGFEIIYNSPVEHIIKKADDCWHVEAGGNTYAARSLIIATGGCSYPTTGSDGSIFKMLKSDLNIKITKLKPSLSSIQIEDYPYTELSGITFENVQITILNDGRNIMQNEDALLFTHHDLSGPAVLNISKYADTGNTIKINYLYPMNYEQVLDKLKQITHGAKGNPAGIIASEFNLPKRFCQLFVERYGSALKNLAGKLTGEEFIIKYVSGFNKAMATSGGIDLSEIKTSTMELKNHERLFAIGEVLDIDGITGGYNLQFAYSSARAAATAIVV